MEDTLRDEEFLKAADAAASLNPCFNGRYSQRQRVGINYNGYTVVLILVLMEDTLRGFGLLSKKNYS